MIEELDSKYEELKGVIDVLPINTKYNRKRKIDCIMDEVKNDNDRLNLVKAEIESRISHFKELSINPMIAQLEQELEKCNIANEWNNFNTSYEKMHLDYYLYQLSRYYKEDLTSVNACIKKIVESFKKVDIVLTKEDFNFNNYVSQYMEKLLNNATDEELKDIFEEIYWKNSDVIKIMEANFKNLYLKNEKKIDKHYESRHEEFLKNHKDEELYEMRINLSDKIKELKGVDACLNFQKFSSGEFSLADFKDEDMQKKRELYFSGDSYNSENLYELYKVLNEYQILIKYKYLFDDMKTKLEKKDELKNSKANALKEISKEETQLIKLNAKQNKKGLFGKKKNDEKWLFEYKNVLTSILDHYNEFDNACFNDLVYERMTQDSSVIDVLKLIISNYLYFVEETFKLDENQDINDITDKFENLKNYVNNNHFVLLNNVALLDEKQMKQLIVDKYNLGQINLTIDNLVDDNLEKTIADIKQLIDYENIINSGINVDDIALYSEYNKLIAAEDSH